MNNKTLTIITGVTCFLGGIVFSLIFAVITGIIDLNSWNMNKALGYNYTASNYQNEKKYDKALELYKKSVPKAETHELSARDHFVRKAFPEIIETIKGL